MLPGMAQTLFFRGLRRLEVACDLSNIYLLSILLSRTGRSANRRNRSGRIQTRACVGACAGRPGCEPPLGRQE